MSSAGANRRAALRRGAMALTLVAAAGWPAVATAAPDVREVLSKKTYHFCHDEQRRLSEHAGAWCPLLPEDASRCPALPAACRAPRLDGGGGAGGGVFLRGRDEADGELDEGVELRGPGRAEERGGAGVGPDGFGAASEPGGGADGDPPRDDPGEDGGDATGGDTASRARDGDDPRGGGAGGVGRDSGAEDSGDDARGEGEGAGDEGGAGEGGEGGAGEGGEGSRAPDRSRPGDAAAPRDDPGDEEASVEEPEDSVTRSSLAPIAHVLVWVIVIAMILLLLFNLRGPRLARGPAVAREPERDDSEEERGEDPERPSETDVERLLRRARRRADSGQLLAAVGDVHSALLRRLAAVGRIELHRSRTNGDHLRSLAREPELQQAVRVIMREVERTQFGGGGPTRAQFDQLLERARALVGSLVAIAVFAWTCLACQGDEPRAQADEAWGVSPWGQAAVVEYLQRGGLELRYRGEPLTGAPALTPDGPTPLVLDLAELTRDEWGALLDHVRGGGRAVLATRERLPAELEVGYARREGAVMAVPRGSPLRDVAAQVAAPDHEGVVVGHPGARTLIADADGTAYIVELELGAGEILVIADDRLLENAALAVPDNGPFLLELLRPWGPEFAVVEGGLRAATAVAASAGGRGSDSPFAAVWRAELTPVILQLLLVILLLYLWRGWHFGQPRDPPPRSRRRFTEHADALAQHYLRAGARRHALRVYSGWALERMFERYGGRRGGLQRLAERIAARSGRDETEVARLLALALDARDDERDGHGDDEDVATLRELGRLVEHTRGAARARASESGGAR